MTLHIPFDNSYARLPGRMFAALPPTPVRAPRIIAVNDGLARLMGIDPSALARAEAELAGNALPEGAAPIAQAYAGHQFGAWNPGLGDGRAILLGEVVGTDGIRRDIVLKGAGPTPFSRMGDGRAWLGPVLREYLVSEAMAAMGVPTTRALAAVTTGEDVYREDRLPGAILTRVAQSHVRVGTFQYFAARGDGEALAALADHVIARHYPQATGPADLLEQMMARQARLIAQWMGLGFIHGVMNTDNMAISGETIDYGPCAFMDVYHPDTVFSSIDRTGRYAWSNQPLIAHWNIAQFASALVPLMPDQDAAVEDFTAIINRFPALYRAAWLEVFGQKLGLAATEDDAALIDDLLALMAQDGADFTNVFARLGTPAARDEFLDRAGFEAWETRWQARGPDTALMARTNPQVIPRTHLIEAAITAGVTGDLGPFHAMLAAVTQPFVENAAYMRPPAEDERVLRTFCGT
ncbi:MAG: YdiU family protein [Limimaricola sp.]|uniref:protein adenylyltransferase SelO n=1 Tax=Limimaricola sp. TaxID=2211665 RepID=UPI001D2AA2FB|nr:YdiU family protein [Limimaricola sp.]MBI1418363.1 YdiU family protein [Limimaricola sp.]